MFKEAERRQSLLMPGKEETRLPLESIAIVVVASVVVASPFLEEEDTMLTMTNMPILKTNISQSQINSEQKKSSNNFEDEQPIPKKAKPLVIVVVVGKFDVIESNQVVLDV